MRIGTFLVVLTLLFSATLFSQTTNIDRWMGFPQQTEETPDWAKEMYSVAPNVFEVDRLYNAYYKTHNYEKNIDARNYKHWRAYLAKFNYIQEDGSILIPDAKTQVEESRAIEQAWQKRQSAAESSSAWTTIGPFVMKDENNLGKSNQSCLVAMDHSLSNSNFLVAVNQNGAIFKTLDGAQNWTLISTGQNFNVDTWNNASIRIHPTNPDTILFSDRHRIYKTTNGGTTWSEIYYQSELQVTCIEFNKSSPNIISFASEKGIYRSVNSGTTWTQILPNNCWELIDHPTNSNIFYALVQNANTTRSDFYKSTDGGATYSIRSSGWYMDVLVSGGAGRMAVTDANTSVIYAFIIGQVSGDTQSKPIVGVMKSSDSGETWTKVLQHNDRKGIDSGQGYYDLDIGVSDFDANIVVLGSQGYWRTTDGFANVASLGGGQHADIQEMQVHGQQVWIASDGGIDKYGSDLTGRVSMNNGMYGSEFWGFDHAWNEDFLVGSYYHNGVSGSRQSFYGTGIHRNVAGGEPSTGYIDLLEPGKSWFSYPGGRTFPETVNGTTKSFSYNLFPNEEAWSVQNKSEIVSLLPYANHHILGKENVLYISKDAGATFDTLKVFGTNTGHKVTGIEVSRQNPKTWYVFQRNSTGTLWRTTDGGQTFAAVTQAAGAPTSSGAYLSLDPANDQTLFMSYNYGGSNNTKIYKTTDAGVTWTNLSTNLLDGKYWEDIRAIPHTNGGVYIMSYNEIYYRNNTHTEWQNCSAGLPARTLAKHLRPFYAKGKMRMASLALGAWEMNLVAEPNDVIAEPITATDSIFCSRDTVQFESYSVINHTGATWAWSFSPTPLWVDNANKRNPRVVFGANGNYSATLTITDANNATDTKTVTDIVKVNSQCDATGQAGKALRTYADGDRMVSTSNLTNITHYTMTAWIKPEASQPGFGGIVTNGEWCAHCDNLPYGLCFDYWGNNLHYRWSDLNSWASTTNLNPIRNAWNYVAMTVTPDTIKVYLNEQIWAQARTSTPVDISSLYVGWGHYSHSSIGEIDEVTVWNRTLSADEIYRMRHITKDMLVDTMSNLVGYYQFNNVFGNSTILDNGRSSHGNLEGGANLITSTAPIGGGKAELLPISNSVTLYDFATLNVKVEFPSCKSDVGKMVVSRLNVLPDSMPNQNANSNSFWTIDYYGNSNSSFMPLQEIKLTPSNTSFTTGLSKTSDAVLWKRGVNEFRNNWTTTNRAASSTGNTLSFNRNSAVSTSTQLFLTNRSTYFDIVTVPDLCNPDTIPGGNLATTAASNSYGHIPHSSSLNFGATTDFTVTVWVKTATTSSDAVIVAKKDWDSGALPGWVISTTSGKLWVNVGDGTNRTDIKPSNLLNDDKWHHVAVSFTRLGYARVYLDGIEIGSALINNVGNIDNTLHMGIGADSENDYRLAGQIDELCIYNAALSQAQIREQRHLCKAKNTTNLLSYYQFNEPGSALYDRKGSNHGYLASTAASLSTSAAPVGSGISEGITIASGSPTTFINSGITLDFTNSNPNGEVVVSRLNVPPDTKPTGVKLVDENSYWIVNNYGTNTIAMDAIAFDKIKGISSKDVGQSSAFNLYKRNSNAHGNTWGSSIDVADLVAANGNGTGQVSFIAGNNITSFSQFVISDNRGVLVSPKVFLQGAYSSPMLRDDIRSKYLMPNKEPYTALGFIHKNGGGGEECSNLVFNTTGNNAIVDWVFIELRDKNNASAVLYTRSALLQRDGDVVDMDGISPVNFKQAIADNYYIAVRHRNHLGAMLASTIALTSTTSAANFTNTATWGSNAQKNLGSGVMGLWSGDGNHDRKVIYQGAGADITPLTSAVYSNPLNINFEASFPVTGYLVGDYNMDGTAIYQGAGADITPITLSVYSNPLNINFEASFPVIEQLP